MNHYVVMNHWSNADCCEFDQVTIVGIAHSLEEAKEIFNKQLVEEREIAEENGWEILEDCETEFEAGEDGAYTENHTRLYIQEVFYELH